MGGSSCKPSGVKSNANLTFAKMGPCFTLLVDTMSCSGEYDESICQAMYNLWGACNQQVNTICDAKYRPIALRNYICKVLDDFWFAMGKYDKDDPDMHVHLSNISTISKEHLKDVHNRTIQDGMITTEVSDIIFSCRNSH
jgi:hypothetical protein